jgi:PAS domain S-box-containing protein
VRIPPDVPSSDVLTAILDASSDLVVVFDANGHIHDLNAAADHLLGRARESWIGTPLTGFVHPDDRTGVVDRLADIWEAAASGTTFEPLSFRAAHAEGFWATLEMTGGHRIAGGQGWSAVVILRDLTQRSDIERRLRQTAQELDFVASHDQLTSLPNRQVLRARLDALSRRVRSSDWPAHLIMLRILGFDDLREQHGDDTITSTVRNFASRVIGEAGEDSFVAADGIGELVVVTEPGRTDSEIRELVERLSSLADAVEPRLTVAIGVSNLRPAQSAKAALDRVTAAAAVARLHGGSRPVVFDDHEHDHSEPDRPALERVQAALRDDELTVWYQPIIDTRSGHLDGFEGLLRWIHPQAGVMVAGEFLSAAAGSSLMLEIDEFVMATGCRQLAGWQQRLGDRAPTLALNISTERLRTGSLAELVIRHLERSGADPRGLCLEVTETHVILQEPEAARQLGVLCDLGVRLALDDFGTGSSSLHHLHDIRADELKIDRAFVELLGHDAGATAIVRASVEMGAAFGLTSTAEGVTTVAQRQFLHQIGCDRIQGFLIGPAVSAMTADAIIGDHLGSRPTPSAEVLHGIDVGRRELTQVDDHYHPSDEEIAAVAGVTPGDVRAEATPPRLEPLGHSGPATGATPGREPLPGADGDDQKNSDRPVDGV